MEEEQGVPQLVVIGASAGGIEALSALVATLEPSFPAPIVIAQHLDPRRHSRLAEILSSHTQLPVTIVQSRETLRPGTLYVVPADRDVEITDHTVRVRRRGASGSVPSIDRLLASAAAVYGERLIAVILTGRGSDGVVGARAVKQAGGTVVIQNPQTAAFPEMPLALAPSTVDVVADLDRIGRILHDLLTGAYMPDEPGAERALRTFLDEIHQRSGIDFSAYKRPTILRRLQRRMAAVGAASLREYRRYVDRQPSEYQRLVSTFLIKVTEFFRDPELFDYLRRRVLPGLIDEARAAGRELRIWSAGCSTGEEAYSLAILVADLLGPDLDAVRPRIFATDVDDDAVQFARRGVYAAGALAGLPPSVVERHFTRVDDHYETSKLIRGLVVFGQHDLGQRAPFPRIDLALCRNVLIYFTPELQRRALQLFAFSLRPGGCLVLGKSETTAPLAELFALEDVHLRIYRRLGGSVVVPSLRPGDLASAAPLGVSVPRAGPRRAPSQSTINLTEMPPPGETPERVLQGLAIGVVIVDRRYEVLRINGIARRLLGVHRPAVGEDLIHVAPHEGGPVLRAGIDAALRGELTNRDVDWEDAAAGATRRLRISASPYPADGAERPVRAVQLVIVDLTAEAAQRSAEQRSSAADALEPTDAEALRARLRQLETANRELIEANEALAATNADLTSARDAFLIGTEEAQAALEEVETLNEELQATNEELETLNEELQATVEELNTTNEDLTARDGEMHDLTARLESERSRLAAILAGLADAVAVVDASGAPLLTNDAYDRTFGGSAADAPLEGDDGRPLPAGQNPLERAARGESFTTQFARTGDDGSRRWYEAVARPLDGNGAAAGVVVIRDITERSLRQIQEEFVGLATHELRTPLTVVRGYLQRLLRALPEDEADGSARAMAARAEEQTHRLELLVRDVQDVTRLRSGSFPVERVPIDLAEPVERAVESARAMGGDREVRLERPDGPIPVLGDARRLEQVALNLLTNALQHAPQSRAIDVRLRRADGSAELEVEDHGPGIPAADLPRVFARFYRGGRGAAEGGSALGLGLPVARAIVTAHGGTIDVRSVEGQGTAFVVRLPLAEGRDRS